VTKTVPSGGTLLTGTATCPSGKVPVGGGAIVIGVIDNGGDGTGPHVFESYPSSGSWTAGVIAASAYSGSFSLNVYAVCVNQ